ncbi:hypothetical protein V1477_017320 [Vespula maculifrons]|uniref:Uncharacterized protein n=1 Tax=Vespula maculifrons TaxID=7453 RepID=A0ABD2B5P9_VESMC
MKPRRIETSAPSRVELYYLQNSSFLKIRIEYVYCYYIRINLPNPTGYHSKGLDIRMYEAGCSRVLKSPAIILIWPCDTIRILIIITKK